MQQLAFALQARVRDRPRNWRHLSAESGENRAPDARHIHAQLGAIDQHYDEPVAFSKNSSQGIVIRHVDHIAVVFRGTDEIGDWLDNVNAVSVDHDLGEVHRGFQAALMDIWPEMKSAVRDLQPKDESLQRPKDKKPQLPLWLTGHSLGGALATLAAAQLVVEDRPFYGLYTFGSPRVGDRRFARTFNVEAKARTFRFQNNNDIVTRVPARVMGYSHVGSFVYISEDMKTFSTDPGFWYQFLDNVRGVISDIGELGVDAIDDHSIGDYVRAIEMFGDSRPDGM